MPGPNSSTPLLTLDNVARRFGARPIIRGVSLAVGAGEIAMVVGPNGSGKSTLARLAVGLLKPHGGSVRLRGADPRSGPGCRGGIGYLGHESQLYHDLSPTENLRFAARLHEVPNPDSAASAALDRLGVGAERAVPIRRLSRGLVQRVALARSLVAGPELIVWDEPLSGLDRAAVARVIELLAGERAQGRGILIISHELPDLWGLTARVHLLEGGAIRHQVDTSTSLEAFEKQYAAAVG